MRRGLRTRSAAAITVALVAGALGWPGAVFAHHSTGYYSKEQKDFVTAAPAIVRDTRLVEALT